MVYTTLSFKVQIHFKLQSLVTLPILGAMYNEDK